MSMSPLRCLARHARFLFFSVGSGGISDPAPVFVSRTPRLDPLAIAGTVTLQHRLKFGPVDGSKVIVLSGFVPLQCRIRNGEAQKVGLRSRDINKLLPQLIIGEALDLPTHGLRRMLRVPVTRPKHHDGRPPPA